MRYYTTSEHTFNSLRNYVRSYSQSQKLIFNDADYIELSRENRFRITRITYFNKDINREIFSYGNTCVIDRKQFSFSAYGCYRVIDYLNGNILDTESYVLFMSKDDFFLEKENHEELMFLSQFFKDITDEVMLVNSTCPVDPPLICYKNRVFNTCLNRNEFLYPNGQYIFPNNNIIYYYVATKRDGDIEMYFYKGASILHSGRWNFRYSPKDFTIDSILDLEFLCKEIKCKEPKLLSLINDIKTLYCTPVDKVLDYMKSSERTYSYADFVGSHSSYTAFYRYLAPLYADLNRFHGQELIKVDFYPYAVMIHPSSSFKLLPSDKG